MDLKLLQQAEEFAALHAELRLCICGRDLFFVVLREAGNNLRVTETLVDLRHMQLFVRNNCQYGLESPRP